MVHRYYYYNLEPWFTYLEDFREKGVALVAVSPELPDQSLSTSEKLSLKFPVLSDVDSKLARQLGISVIQPAAMQYICSSMILADQFSRIAAPSSTHH